MLDKIDRKLLALLQQDCTLSLQALAEAVNLTTTPCWKRLKRLEDDGILIGKVALLDPEKIGLGLTAFVLIKTQHHSSEWYCRFSAVLIFVVVWLTLSYIPIAHMVWGGGLLASHGALDFAGGTVVHINAAIAGLVGAYLIGKRVGFGKEAFKPHNLPMVFTGTAILYIGWFGFNAGSAGTANEIAALAFVNTVVATAAAILGWIFGEWALRGKPSLLGACSGAIAGLVGVTPACGYIGVGGALIIGVVAGLAGLWGVTMLKRLLRVDDPCDVFGVHGVCGIVGCIMTGIFAASSLGGVGFAEGVTMGHQLLVQLESIAITIVWSGVVAFIGYKLADLTVGLRVPEEQEREGLDVNSHGENAYNA